MNNKMSRQMALVTVGRRALVTFEGSVPCLVYLLVLNEIFLLRELLIAEITCENFEWFSCVNKLEMAV